MLILGNKGVTAGIATAGGFAVTNLNFARGTSVLHGVIRAVFHVARNTLSGFTFGFMHRSLSFLTLTDNRSEGQN